MQTLHFIQIYLIHYFNIKLHKLDFTDAAFFSLVKKRVFFSGPHKQEPSGFPVHNVDLRPNQTNAASLRNTPVYSFLAGLSVCGNATRVRADKNHTGRYTLHRHSKIKASHRSSEQVGSDPIL